MDDAENGEVELHGGRHYAAWHTGTMTPPITASRWAIDLCSGVGGGSWALKQLDFGIALSVEVEEQRRRLQHTNCGTTSFETDLTDKSWWARAATATAAGAWITIASPPCQNYSRDGNKEGLQGRTGFLIMESFALSSGLMS